MDIWLVFSFCLLWIVLLWHCEQVFVWTYVFTSLMHFIIFIVFYMFIGIFKLHKRIKLYIYLVKRNWDWMRWWNSGKTLEGQVFTWVIRWMVAPPVNSQIWLRFPIFKKDWRGPIEMIQWEITEDSGSVHSLASVCRVWGLIMVCGAVNGS